MRISIVSYPKRLFDKMVLENAYGPNDKFISIGYSFPVNDVELGPDEPLLPENNPCLRLLFDDVVQDVALPIIGGGTSVSKVITPEQAKRILFFAFDIADGATIHVHCQQGQSRSVGVAEALTDCFKAHKIAVDVKHLNAETNANKAVRNAILQQYAENAL